MTTNEITYFFLVKIDISGKLVVNIQFFVKFFFCIFWHYYGQDFFGKIGAVLFSVDGYLDSFKDIELLLVQQLAYLDQIQIQHQEAK